MNNTIYLVTGAAGFLGSTTCRQLIKEGKKVRGFVLPNDPAAKYLPEEVEVIYGDLCDKESVEKFFAVPEGTESICLHIASIVTVTPEYNQKVVDVNVGGTNNIIDAVLSHPECRKLVYCSSTGAIPEAPKGTPIKEVYKFEPEKLIDCYSQTKAQATQNVLDAVNERGLHACVVHPSGILGPEDYSISETTGTLIKIIKGDMPAGIDGSFNLSDVRDLANGTILAAEKGRDGECYILANAEITFREFCKLIAAESGCKPIKMFLPLKVAYTFGRLAEWNAKRSGKKALMTTFSVYNLARNNTFDYSKAKEELGYTTRSCAETVRDEIAWLKKEGKI
ncbi:MAG: NAD-dependent epimerase/dehydratase family protein [Oscillospiraceae bacterium]|nr:NAD-dependent epimerase/dehydratase family protein [Oscillospiraceae bacterium]